MIVFLLLECRVKDVIISEIPPEIRRSYKRASLSLFKDSLKQLGFSLVKPLLQ